VLRYDRFIMLEIFAKCADQADRAVVYTSDTSWIDWNVVATLQEHKRQIKSDFAELTEQAHELWQATAEGILFEYDPDEPCETPPPCSFWPLLNQNEVQAPQSGMVLTVPQHSAFFSTAPAVMTWGFSDTEAFELPQVSVPTDQCRYCYGRGCLVEHDVPLKGMVFVSSYCLFCGWADSQPEYFLSSFTQPLVLLTLLEALTCFADLLRIVIAAVAVLISRLRRTALRHAIVTAQRSFFTHHGAHPPRIQPPHASGLFPEKAFQLRAVA
jgi:hypothetical protein